MSSRRTRHAPRGAVAVALALALFTPRARAGPTSPTGRARYTFTNVADTSGPIDVFGEGAAVGDSGAVAFAQYDRTSETVTYLRRDPGGTPQRYLRGHCVSNAALPCERSSYSHPDLFRISTGNRQTRFLTRRSGPLQRAVRTASHFAAAESARQQFILATDDTDSHRSEIALHRCKSVSIRG